MQKQTGFSLIELLAIISIIAILTTITHPLYQRYLIRTKRARAEAQLIDLASRMEAFYTKHNSYQNATLADLGFKTHQNAYRFTITTPTPQHYTLTATPTTLDPLCGQLILNNYGSKHINGTGTIQACW